MNRQTKQKQINNEWISADKYLPPVGESVLVCRIDQTPTMDYPAMVIRTGCVATNEARHKWMCDDIGLVYFPKEVTHWMPLPNLPDRSEPDDPDLKIDSIKIFNINTNEVVAEWAK